MTSEILVSAGIVVILLGFLLVFIGSILTKSKGKVEGGFAIWIGPIPIIGATSKQMFYAVLLVSLIFLVVYLILIKGSF